MTLTIFLRKSRIQQTKVTHVCRSWLIYYGDVAVVVVEAVFGEPAEGEFAWSHATLCSWLSLDCSRRRKAESKTDCDDDWGGNERCRRCVETRADANDVDYEENAFVAADGVADAVAATETSRI